MAGLDLTGVARFLDSLILVDTVVVGRAGTAGGFADDDVDVDGQVVEPPAVYVGTDTAAAIVGLTSTALAIESTPEVQQIIHRSQARARLLLRGSSELDVRLGDHVWATTANAPIPDPTLADYEWEVVHEATPSSFTVARILYLKVAGHPYGIPAAP